MSRDCPDLMQAEEMQKVVLRPIKKESIVKSRRTWMYNSTKPARKFYGLTHRQEKEQAELITQV